MKKEYEKPNLITTSLVIEDVICASALNKLENDIDDNGIDFDLFF